jgi:ADP-heptose:LPS heptosyltransferase
MFDHLEIYDPRERWLVGLSDLAVRVSAPVVTLGSRGPAAPPRRILLLRLERIGDLLMTLGAIETVRRRAPEAAIHLVVGSWNRSLAEMLTAVTTVESLDAPWLARGTRGDPPWRLVRQAGAWRGRFDLAINFEPDVRGNALIGWSRTPRRVGFSSGGGGGWLTDALVRDPAAHTAVNAGRIVDLALPPGLNEAESPAAISRLVVPEGVRHQASQLLRGVGSDRVLVGVHASGGRPVKQWPVERLAGVATRLARERGAVIVLTGTPADRPLVDGLAAALPRDVTTIDVAGEMALPVFAGLLECLSVFVTPDTGPMHLAAAVGTPVVGIFGPSDPARYGPLSDRARVVTADLWCRPCNRVRRPPDRCVGRVPDCLKRIDEDAVYHATDELLSRRVGE